MNQMQILNMLINQNPQCKSNPMFNNAMQMMNSGNNKGLKELAENLARQKGVNLDDLRKQIGM